MEKKVLKDLNEDVSKEDVMTIDDLQEDNIEEVDRTLNAELYRKLDYLGILPSVERSYNIGKSNYSEHTIQPWSIWLDYPELTSWDHDIIKRVLRTKEGESRFTDYEKIIHDCEERIRQLRLER